LRDYLAFRAVSNRGDHDFRRCPNPDGSFDVCAGAMSVWSTRLVAGGLGELVF
jgi:hypothetical protein